MSTTKSGGSTRLGRDSESKRLGIKITQGQKAKVGMIIVRQRGSAFIAGRNVKKGGDDTIYAMKDGVVKFTQKSKLLFNGTKKTVKSVSVESKK